MVRQVKRVDIWGKTKDDAIKWAKKLNRDPEHGYKIDIKSIKLKRKTSSGQKIYSGIRTPKRF